MSQRPPSRRRRILMSALHYWGSPFQVASHHLARQLARRGHEVCYLSAPITPLHLLRLRAHGMSARISQWRRPVRSEGVTAWVPAAVLAPDNRPWLDGAWLARNWQRLSIPPIRTRLQQLGFGQVDLLYLDNPYHSGLCDLVDAGRVCYHMADDYSGFPGFSEGLRASEARLAQRADLVLLPSDELRGVVERIGGCRRVETLYNGVDLAQFGDAAAAERPASIASLAGPIAVYVGALERWLDADLLRAVAERLREVNFVLAGPAGPALRELRAPNIHWIGPVTREMLPRLLAHADVGLIPFDVARFRALLDPVRPLKLFEYLAAGLPVVTTPWRELDLLGAPVSYADTAEGFVQRIRALLQHRPGRAGLHDFVRQHDWEMRAHRFEQLVFGD